MTVLDFLTETTRQGASDLFIVAGRPLSYKKGGKLLEIDGERVPLAAGDWLRIAPCAKRRFFASEKSEIKYICIQVKENSLKNYTAGDAVIG